MSRSVPEGVFYRLNVFPIHVPPLRDRPEDILLAYDWPGNIRELQNVIERAVICVDESWLRPESGRDTPANHLFSQGIRLLRPGVL